MRKNIIEDDYTLSSCMDGCLTDQAIIAIVPEPLDKALPLIGTTQHLICLKELSFFIDLDKCSAVGVRFHTKMRKGAILPCRLVLKANGISCQYVP